MTGGHTQEDSEKTDVLLRRIRDCLSEDLVLSVAGCIAVWSRLTSRGIGLVLLMQAVEPTYLECLCCIVATQTTAITFVSSSPLVTKHACSTSLSLLDHIQPTSILITQLGTESEAILLRERVLSDTVTEQDELIHREEKSGERQEMWFYIIW